jgi:hypothetical protein
MTELRDKINLVIDRYKHHYKPVGVLDVLRYIFAAILVGILIFWIVYSVSPEQTRQSIEEHIDKFMVDLGEYMNPPPSHTNKATPEPRRPDPPTPSFDAIREYKENSAIDVALNYGTRPTDQQISYAFTNDESDSNIQMYNKKYNNIGWSNAF